MEHDRRVRFQTELVVRDSSDPPDPSVSDRYLNSHPPPTVEEGTRLWQA